MHYQPSYSLDQTVDIFEKDTRKEVSDIYDATCVFFNRIEFHEKVGNDTVEGIAFSRDTAVIMTGVFVEEKEVGGDGNCC